MTNKTKKKSDKNLRGQVAEQMVRFYKTRMATTKLVESVNLYFQEGSSDKVYHACLEKDGKTFSVHFSYGRRGGNMTEGYKVWGVSEEAARKEYDKLVASKVKKGYRHS